jgi:hypothetical protein
LLSSQISICEELGFIICHSHSNSWFSPSKSNSSLFIFRSHAHTAYFLLYVDDIILTASSDSFLRQIIPSLHREFSMTDLGPLHHFLCVAVSRASTTLFLSQRQYIIDLLSRAGTTDYQSTHTLADVGTKLFCCW